MEEFAPQKGWLLWTGGLHGFDPDFSKWLREFLEHRGGDGGEGYIAAVLEGQQSKAVLADDDFGEGPFTFLFSSLEAAEAQARLEPYCIYSGTGPKPVLYLGVPEDEDGPSWERLFDLRILQDGSFRYLVFDDTEEGRAQLAQVYKVIRQSS